MPYKSTGLALNDTLGGRLVFCFPAVSSVQGFVKDGRMKVLAISGDRRSALMPDVPTFTEVGFKDMDIGARNAFFAPAATPKEVIDKLNTAIVAALSDPDVAKTLTNQGMLPIKKTPARFASYIHSESDRMAAIIKAADVKME